MIEDVVLGNHPLFLGLQLLYSLFVVHPVEGVELSVLDHTITISVDLEEEGAGLVLFEGEVKVLAESSLEVLKGQEADARVEAGERRAGSLGASDAFLDRLEHSQAL